MADSPKRRNTGSTEIEFESRQLTLEEWAEALRASTARTDRGPRSFPSCDEPASSIEPGDNVTSYRPSAPELLKTPGALLTRSHLRELGLERRAIDAVFRTLAVVFLPGYSRPMIRAQEFLELVEHCTYDDDRVRPCHA